MTVRALGNGIFVVKSEDGRVLCKGTYAHCKEYLRSATHIKLFCLSVSK